jgi:hypothetical protein
MPNIIPNDFAFTEVYTEDVLKEVITLKSMSAPGYDEVAVKPCKYAIDSFVLPLTHIINLSLGQGIFPDMLKIARVAAIWKNGSKSDLGNYRPISVLTVFSKIIEKCILSQLNSYVDANCFLVPQQFGFRRGKSCELALLNAKEYILNCLDENDFAAGLFIDLKKAFDSVDHVILSKKLAFYGIQGLARAVFNNYLMNRYQFVQLQDGSRSDFARIVSGVPQGSILGPLLFLIYINDLVNIYNHATYVMYADDSNIFVRSKTVSGLNAAFSIITHNLLEWTQMNRLRLNVSKTKAILFRNINKYMDCELFISINNVEVAEVKSVMFLGVIFDQHLTWSDHIEHIYSKLRRFVGALSHVNLCLPKKTKLQMYYAMFYSVIYYSLLVYGTTCTTYMTRLLILQKRLIRLVSNSPRLSHTVPLFNELHIVPVNMLYNFKLLRCLHQSSKNASQHRDLARLQLREYVYSTRHQQRFDVPFTRIDVLRQSIRYRAAILANGEIFLYNSNYTAAKLKNEYRKKQIDVFTLYS